MRLPHITGCFAVAGMLIACLLGVTTSAQAASVAPAATTASGASAQLHLKASHSKVSPGSRVRFKVTNRTKVKRTVHVQRWSTKKRAWRTVAKRKVRTSTRVTLSVPKGTWRYRAVSRGTQVRPTSQTTKVSTLRSAVVSVQASPIWRKKRPWKPAPIPTPTVAPTTPAPTVAPTTPTPTPTVAPTTAAPAEQPKDVGAMAIGTASYPIPSGAIYVAPKGTKTGSGTAGDPYGSIMYAIGRAPEGSTLVLRGGNYHETVSVIKRVTLQNHPGEAVWIDGSSTVTGFVKSGSTWVRSGWTAKFDSSPTYGRGQPDGTAAGWQWINPKYPLASHPDQAWINDRKLTQVASRAAVVPGTFYVDYAASQLVLGSDPAAGEVRASDLELGLTITGAGATVRGIGVRRFATPVPEMGTVRVAADRVTLENVVVTENATQGVTGWAANTTLRRVSSTHNGLSGFHSNKSNSYVADRVLAQGNNAEHFNVTPVSAGMKLSNGRGITVKNSVFHDNDGTGLWFDVSNTDVVASGNTITNNTDDGLIVELSARVLAVDNTIRGNASQSVFIFDSSDVRVWNNTIVGSQVPLRIADDERVSGDPNVPWITQNIEIRNNVISGLVKGNNWCGMLCVYDHTKKHTAEQMNVTANGNVYQRADRSSPNVLIRWSNAAAGPVNYGTLDAFRSAKGQEKSGAEIIGAMPAVLPAAGTTIPADIAALLGTSSGSKTVGARR